MKKEKIELNGRTIAFLHTEERPKDSVFMFLAPGSRHSNFFNDYAAQIKDSYLIIPDYPGRGDSEPQEDNSIKALGKTISSLINKLELKNVTLVGYSFGTQVALEIINSGECDIKNVSLVAPGNYFLKPFRPVVKKTFSYLAKSTRARTLVRSFLLSSHISPALPENNLDCLCDQLVSTAEYVYDYKKTWDIPAKIVTFKYDLIADPKSIPVLKSLFSNFEHVEVNALHPQSPSDYQFFVNQYLV